MDQLEWINRCNEEISHAEKARSDGYEGKARVCARRAAGIAIQAYFQRINSGTTRPSAYEWLQALQKQPSLTIEISTIIKHLLMRVDETFSLPPEIDLLQDTRQLIDYLQQQIE